MQSTSRLRLRVLGRTYARQAVPLVREKAAEQRVKLPVRHTELFTLLRTVYESLEKDHHIAWNSLPASWQDAFLHAFWSVMVREKVSLPTLEK